MNVLLACQQGLSTGGGSMHRDTCVPGPPVYGGSENLSFQILGLHVGRERASR